MKAPVTTETATARPCPARSHRRPSGCSRFGALAILAAFTLTGAGADAVGSPEAPSRPSKPLRLGLVRWIGNGPFFIAQEKGLFAAAGVNVELMVMDDFEARQQAFREGRLDGSGESVDALVLARARGLPLVTVMKLDDSFGSDGLVARRPIRNVKALKGRSVAYTPDSPSQFLLLHLLRQEGLGSQDITGLPLGTAEAVAAFAAGRADAVVTWEPWLAEARKTPRARQITTSRDMAGLIADLLVWREETLATRAEDVRRVMRAWFAALEYLRTRRTESLALLSDRLQAPPKSVAPMLDGVRFPSLELNRQYLGATNKPGQFAEAFTAAGALWQQEGRVAAPPAPDRAWDATLLQSLYSDQPYTAGSSRVRRVGRWYPAIDPKHLARQKGAYFVPGLTGYQQTTDYTCGPAALLTLAAYYRVPGILTNRETELRIAREAGTRFPENLPPGGKLGTKPDEMARWLEQHGFQVSVEFESAGDGSALRRLRQNLEQSIPTLVEWADLGGHWVVVVGYDTRNNDDPWDDVLILADSFDRYDDHADGYTFVNANRFYWLWYDAFYFDKLTWRTMIVPRRK